MVQFCYLGLYIGIETVSCRLLQRTQSNTVIARGHTGDRGLVSVITGCEKIFLDKGHVKREAECSLFNQSDRDEEKKRKK